MTWIFTDSLDEFRAHAGGYLAAYPAENTVLLTLVDRLAAGGSAGGDPAKPPRFGWWSPAEGEPVAGAWVQTPPQPVRLSRMPIEAATDLLAALLAEGWPELTGVAGGSLAASAFATAWAEHSRGTVELHEHQRPYRLAELTPPPVPGGMRQAEPADHELLLGWFEAFFADVHVTILGLEDLVARRTAAGEIQFWEEAGRPVAMAGASPVLAGMTRIGQVYTPVEQRGHGYAGALTAGISALMRARGAEEVLLFTDLANRTSNAIYQKIGYRPLEDCLVFNFTG